MNKFSRILTVVVTVLSVGFMGVAALTLAAHSGTDWNARLKEFDSAEISKQQKELTELDTALTVVARDAEAWTKGVEADVKALSEPGTGRIAQYEAHMAALEAHIKKQADEVEAAARKAQAKLDELKLRRDDIYRLDAQYEEVVSQKEAAEAEVKRLRDLLVQAQGVLDRVQRRKSSLEADGAGAGTSYEGEPSSPDSQDAKN